ncbi:MAG: CvpA family protein, partial [Clostridia bacterium]|nr:CvpA family protein [Clostridia bacterium]
MTILIDVLLVLIIAIAGYIGYRKGVVKMLLSFLVILVALASAWGISAPLANGGYTLFFEKSVSDTVDAALENTSQEAVDQAVENLFDSDSVLGGIGSLVGFDTQSVVDEIAGDSLEKVATTLKEDVIKPPVVLLLRCILFILLFVLLWIILSLIAKALSKTAKKLPIIKGFNAWCGGFVGIINGVLL